MTEPVREGNSELASVITRWRQIRADEQGRPMSQRALARALTTALAPHGSVTYASIQLWEKARVRPDYWMLVVLYLVSAGWVRTFALDCLRAQRPDLWSGAEPIFPNPGINADSHSGDS